MFPKRLHNLNKLSLDQIVKIHRSELKESVFNHFSDNFLYSLYEQIVRDESNIFLIIKNKDKIIGFTAAYTDIDKFYSNITRRLFVSNAFEMLKLSLTKPLLIFKIISWYLRRDKKSCYPAQLQFIAIDKNFQGKGYGTALIRKLDKQFMRQNIKKYSVGSHAENKMSNSFYKKLGFTFLTKETLFGEKFNYYVNKLTT